MKILVARHGQTEWNAQNKVCGRTDLPLNQEGLRQAEILARAAVGKGIQRIIASPMLRARQTAGAVAEKLGLPVETDPRLMEQDYGIYEGVSRFDQGFLGNKRLFAFRYPGGESMMQVAARCYPLLEELRDEPGPVLLVCHGGVARVIRSYFVDMSNEEFFHYSMENCQLAEYEI